MNDNIDGENGLTSEKDSIFKWLDDGRRGEAVWLSSSGFTLRNLAKLPTQEVSLRSLSFKNPWLEFGYWFCSPAGGPRGKTIQNGLRCVLLWELIAGLFGSIYCPRITLEILIYRPRSLSRRLGSHLNRLVQGRQVTFWPKIATLLIRNFLPQ